MHSEFAQVVRKTRQLNGTHQTRTSNFHNFIVIVYESNSNEHLVCGEEAMSTEEDIEEHDSPDLLAGFAR